MLQVADREDTEKNSPVSGIPRALAQQKGFGLLKKTLVKDVFHTSTYTNELIMNYNFDQIIYNSN